MALRVEFQAQDSVKHLWRGLNLPEASLQALNIHGTEMCLPSSFKIAHLAQASIALSALTAALIHSTRYDVPITRVTVPRQHAAIEFCSEKLYTLDGKPPVSSWGPIGGLHKTADGYVRVHDNFSHHRDGVKSLLRLPRESTRGQVADEIAKWKAADLETAGFENALVISALRSYEEWDQTVQAQAVAEFPILIRKIGDSPAGLPTHMRQAFGEKCLRGLRVLEMSRVIAAPVCGKTLAAHGADVLWVTSPNLPDLPALDKDVGRGKRTCQLDIDTESGRETLNKLLSEADVFIQGYRPGSLAAKGFSSTDLVRKVPRGIICANLSAYGPTGPWSQNRGFDSLVQTCSGMNASEAEHYGKSEPAKPMPCQALDHAAGYFLAAGVNAALYRQAMDGGSYEINVSLAGVMKYLRSLGQFEGRLGFECDNFETIKDVPPEYVERRGTAFGELVRRSASNVVIHAKF